MWWCWAEFKRTVSFHEQTNQTGKTKATKVSVQACSKMSEKLCLKWNDFQENVNIAFGSLREDTEFADVTLACEDGQQEEARKVIFFVVKRWHITHIFHWRTIVCHLNVKTEFRTGGRRVRWGVWPEGWAGGQVLHPHLSPNGPHLLLIVECWMFCRWLVSQLTGRWILAFDFFMKMLETSMHTPDPKLRYMVAITLTK